MSVLSKKLARRVRLLRQRRSWSQQRLGRIAGFTYKFIGQIERGEVSPTLNSLEKLARALGLQVGEFLSFEEAKKRKTKEDILSQISPAEIRLVKNALRILDRLFK
ncbi:MAG TPA: helix-turn-helix domain-containing protein [Candidatus Acidoferrales bacterium]|nr:helix-turn-helix domain-containing protein [Candidatus Acidoferrales bacterium]